MKKRLGIIRGLQPPPKARPPQAPGELMAIVAPVIDDVADPIEIYGAEQLRVRIQYGVEHKLPHYRHNLSAWLDHYRGHERVLYDWVANWAEC
eukprot:4434317-Heterocapsa_arctica.AAC.1